MKLKISSRTGRFDLCSYEESVSCNICVYDNENKRIKSANLSIENEENPEMAYVEDAIYLLEEDFKKMWIDTSRKEKEELLQFLKENEEEIDKGTKLHRIETLNNKITRLQEEIKILSI